MRTDNLEPSEFEIQAEAYIRLKERFTHVRGEYHWRSANTGKRAARFDIAILSPDGELKLIIEIKKRNRKRSLAQATKYGTLTGKPVLYLRGMDEGKAAVSLVLKYLMDTSLGTGYLLEMM